MDSPGERIDRVGDVLPDEVSRVDVAEVAGDRDEVVNASGLEIGFLWVEPQLDRRNVVAVKDHVEVAPVGHCFSSVG